jgi:hypothetical protein
MIRGGIFAVLCAATIACSLFALGTELASWSKEEQLEQTHYVVDIWYMCARVRNTVTGVETVAVCSRTTAERNKCPDYGNRFFVMQAFYTLTALASIFGLICATKDTRNEHSDTHFRYVLLLSALLILAFSGVSWGVALGMPREHFCEHDPKNNIPPMKDEQGFRWGVSPFMMVVNSVLAVAMIVVAIATPAYRHLDDVPSGPLHGGHHHHHGRLTPPPRRTASPPLPRVHRSGSKSSSGTKPPPTHFHG